MSACVHSYDVASSQSETANSCRHSRSSAGRVSKPEMTCAATRAAADGTAGVDIDAVHRPWHCSAMLQLWRQERPYGNFRVASALRRKETLLAEACEWRFPDGSSAKV